MFGAISSLGSGIGTNLLSDVLLKKLAAFNDQKAVQNFKETLYKWEIQFEQENDGTIVTTSAFYSYIQHYHVVESILSYILNPLGPSVSEKTFLANISSQITKYLEEKTVKTLSWSDNEQIEKFLDGLSAMVKEFLLDQIPLQDRGLLYILCQNHIELEEIKDILKQFRVRDQMITSIQDQLSSLMKDHETENDITEKLILWNSREIKNLGDRYSPEVNIPLDIAEAFQGAALDPQFKNDFLETTDRFLISMQDAAFKELQQSCSAIAQIVTEMEFFNLTKDNINQLLSPVDDISMSLTRKIDEYRQTDDKKSLDDVCCKRCISSASNTAYSQLICGRMI